MKKVLKKYTSIKNYIDFLKKQPSHMQHMYAIVFAASITALIAFVILYADYGFWHERYTADNTSTTKVSSNELSTTTEIKPESPSEMIIRFFNEAKIQLQNINASGSDLLRGKETYSSDDEQVGVSQ